MNVVKQKIASRWEDETYEMFTKPECFWWAVYDGFASGMLELEKIVKNILDDEPVDESMVAAAWEDWCEERGVEHLAGGVPNISDAQLKELAENFDEDKMLH